MLFILIVCYGEWLIMVDIELSRSGKVLSKLEKMGKELFIVLYECLWDIVVEIKWIGGIEGEVVYY